MASTAGSTAVDTQVSGPQSGGISQRLSDFGTFIYNGEEGKVLGRTGKSWGALFIFFCIFYTLLGCFFYGLMYIFMLSIDKEVPKLMGSDSLLKAHTGKILIFFTIYYICLAGFFGGMLAVFYHSLDWNVPKLMGTDSLLKQTPAQIGIFFLIYYICLAGFFAGMLAVFYHTLDWNVPKLQGTDTLLKQTPGLAFRPLPNVETTLIRFNKARASTYTPYVDHIESFLQYYENEYQQTESGLTVDCSTFSELRPHEDWDKACRFEIIDLGDDCVKQQSFGYEDGQPCVLLKLNRIFDWMPEPYTNETRPAEIADTWTQYAVTVHCEGENAADKDNLGDIYYFPNNGFHFKYFPYRNQQGYRSPLVFVRFDNPAPAQLLMVTCKVYAKNMKHDSMERAGMVHFELMVD